jgi:xanthine dehydrogenase YagS FAD-binding subunit
MSSLPGGLSNNLTPKALPQFGYVAPSALDDAIALLAKYKGGAKVMAGGSDLLHLLKRGAILPVPKVIVDIKKIAELHGLSFDPVSGLSLGALVTIAEVGGSELLAVNYPLLGRTAGYISSPQVRNVATVGGALSQQVWCWFLRNGLRCWRAGGNACYATLDGADNRYYFSVMGGADCYAAHPSDLAVALEALDASVVVAGSFGTKTMTMAEFLPGNVWMGEVLQSHVLSPTEIVTAVNVPPPAEDVRSVFVKSRIRNAFDFAIASVAVALMMDGTTVKESRVVFGGVSPAPYRDVGVEAMLNGNDLSSIAPDEAAAAALSSAAPLQNNAYKLDVARGVLKEAIEELTIGL